jgi:hypothetical protein
MRRNGRDAPKPAVPRRCRCSTLSGALNNR